MLFSSPLRSDHVGLVEKRGSTSMSCDSVRLCVDDTRMLHAVKAGHTERCRINGYEQ